MLNAGIMAVPPALTRDGYEIEFGTNHMGHALLTKLLLPLLLKTAASTATSTPNHHPDVRIVSLSSHGHTFLPKGGFNFASLKTKAEDMGIYGRYYQSKLANILWARQLAREYPQLTVTSVHPGLVQTQIYEESRGAPGIVRFLTRVGKRLLTPVDQGVRNQLWAAVGAGVESGEYYEPVGVKGAGSEDARDEELAGRVWEWTQRELEGVCG
jgi:NAD(P)-dependent dehydrogenase (short-subunit alcohol dehydrogenase family)